MNIVKNDSQAPASSSSHWETKALIVASVVVLAASVFFAYHFQGHNPPLFYASCGGGGLSITVLTIFAIRSCRACSTQKKVRDSLPAGIFSNDPMVSTRADEPTTFMRNDQINNNASHREAPQIVVNEPASHLIPQPLIEPARVIRNDQSNNHASNGEPALHQIGVNEPVPLPQPVIEPLLQQPIVNVALINDQKEEIRNNNLASSIIAPPLPLNAPRNVRLPARLQRLDSLKQIDNPLRRKHRISRLENVNSKNISGTQEKPKPTWRGYLWKPFAACGKYITRAVDFLLGGGHLQQRAYYHLLSSLLDPITSFLGYRVSQAPVIEKVNQIVDILKSKHGARFNFLVDPDACNGDLQTSLHLMFMTLIQVANPDQNFATVRYNFYQHLDAAWESEEYQKKIIDFRKIEDKDEAIKKYPEIAFMQMLGFAIFTQMHFGKYADESVFSVFKEGENKYRNHPGKDVPFLDIIKEDHASIDRIDQSFLGGYLFKLFNRAQGTANVMFSPLEKNNFASVWWRSLYQVGNKLLPSTCLRFGTPTSENFNDPTILPVMRLFLDYCQREGLKVVSMQHQNPQTKWGDESKRLQKMFDLAKEYEGTFFVFGLPMDGPFFKQKGKYSDKKWENATSFIGEFFAHLTGKQNDSLIQLPLKQLKKPKLLPNAEKEIGDILKYVHEKFFQSSAQMTIDERQIFQLITYAYLVEYFTLGLEADFHHCQCKDAQDRAVVLLTTINQISAIRLGKENDPQEIRKSRALIEFACLMIKGMSLHEHRFPLLEKIVQHLSSLSDEQKDSIRKHPIKINGKDCVLKEVITEDVPNQSLHRLPSEARSIEEYDRLLKDEVARKKKFKFKLNFFVQNFFDNYDKKGIDGLCKQFRVKDVPRQHYMINGQKLQLASFRDKLSSLMNQKYAKEFKNVDKDTKINEIVSLEEKTVDPLKFCAAINEMSVSETFKKEVVELYNDLRADAVQKFLQTWTNNNVDATKKILAMSQQGVLMDVTAALEQRYRFIQDGPSLDPSREAVPIDSNKTIQVIQRDPKGTANTCFNYLIDKNGRRIVEAYQLYEIVQGDEKKTLNYIVTKTRVDLETGHAQVRCQPLLSSEERPEDISAIVSEANRSVESLVDSFIEGAI